MTCEESGLDTCGEVGDVQRELSVSVVIHGWRGALDGPALAIGVESGSMVSGKTEDEVSWRRSSLSAFLFLWFMGRSSIVDMGRKEK